MRRRSDNLPAALTSFVGREQEVADLVRLLTVRSLSGDIPAKQVKVEYDEAQVNVVQMKELLNEEDYPVDSVP